MGIKKEEEEGGRLLLLLPPEYNKYAVMAGYKTLSPSGPGDGHTVCPTNNALLINFRLSSDAEIFGNEPRLSVQIGTKRAKKKTLTQRVHIPTELPFRDPPLVVG